MEIQTKRLIDSPRRQSLQMRASLVAGAALLVVGLVGFSFTLPYDRQEARLAPLPRVDTFAVKSLHPAETRLVVPNIAAAMEPVVEAVESATDPALSATPVPLARPSAQAAAAAAAPVATVLPPPSPPTPTLTASPTPTAATPKATPAAREGEPTGIRGDGARDGPNPAAVPPKPGLFDTFSTDGGEGPSPAPRDIDPTRPMPR